MNKRIAELYDQAIVVEDCGDYVTGELDPAKFAELIVKECIKCARSDEHSPSYEAVARIARHFGVE